MTPEALFIWGLALIGIAVVLLVAEVFVPSHGLLTATAAVLALAGVVMLWLFDTVWGVIGLLTVLVLGPTVVYWMVKTMPYTPVGRAILGGRPEAEVEAQADAERDHLLRRRSLVGMRGSALSDMHPVGDVLVDGETFEALAEHSWIDAGAEVEVTRADGLEIKVRGV
ncbi:MAG: hypothetical protein H6810_12950 [Phycisphaeraceae bacterium]|nr:MAG: hypothetical protein H6810_12950 [Phycisphaeraceae bacterium]